MRDVPDGATGAESGYPGVSQIDAILHRGAFESAAAWSRIDCRCEIVILPLVLRAGTGAAHRRSGGQERRAKLASPFSQALPAHC